MMVSNIGTWSTIAVYVLDILNEAMVIYEKWMENPKSDAQVMIREKLVWFICKFFDLPVSIT
jgi:hypothetical protein